MTIEDNGDWGSTDEPLLNTQKFATEAKLIVDNDRIRIIVVADQAGKLRVKQGIDADNLDYVQETAISADTPVAIDIAAVGLWGEIEFENDSGSDMTETRLGWKLTS